MLKEIGPPCGRARGGAAMRRRILLYNTVVVLLALAALLLISSQVVRWVGAHYAGQDKPEDPPNVAAVGELLETWEGPWTDLARRLEGLGYQLRVTLDGAEVFSTLSDVQGELLRQGGGAAEWPEGEAADLWTGRALAVGIRSGGYTLVAMSRPDHGESRQMSFLQGFFLEFARDKNKGKGKRLGQEREQTGYGKADGSAR